MNDVTGGTKTEPQILCATVPPRQLMATHSRAFESVLSTPLRNCTLGTKLLQAERKLMNSRKREQAPFQVVRGFLLSNNYVSNPASHPAAHYKHFERGC